MKGLIYMFWCSFKTASGKSYCAGILEEIKAEVETETKVSKPQAVRVTAQVFIVVFMEHLKLIIKVSKPQAVRVTAQAEIKIGERIDFGEFQNRKR